MSDHTYIEDGEQGQFPSLEQLNRYLKGEMSEEERQALESRMVDDPLFADVIEGLGKVKDTSQMNQSIARIRTATRKKLLSEPTIRPLNSKRKSRVQPKTFTQLSLSIAAGISLLLVSVWLVREMAGLRKTAGEDLFAKQQTIQEAPIATAEQPEETPAMPADTVLFSKDMPLAVETHVSQEDDKEDKEENMEKIYARARTTGQSSGLSASSSQGDSQISNRKELAVNEQEYVSPAKSPQNIEREDVEDQAPAFILQDSIHPSDAPKPAAEPRQEFTEEELAQITEHKLEEADKIYSNSVPPKDSKRSRRNQAKEDAERQRELLETFEAPAMSEKQLSKAKVERANVIADLLEEASQLYHVKNYEAAKLKIEEVLQSSPGNESAMYMMGRNYLAMDNPKKAISWLKPILENPSSMVYDDTKWELANAYLMMNKIRPAKKMLESLREAQNPYLEPATLKLDSLNRL